MGMPSTKVHRFTRGLWEHEPTSLTLGRKRLCPIAPKLATTFDLKSFIRPESIHRKPGSSDYQNKHCTDQVEAQSGGTRWNPTREQIGILEMTYRGGMRTPNAQQIEQIIAELGKYGKIEGKNVFYWFQNHKARERQKQKRNSRPRTPPSPFTTACPLLYPEDGVEEELDYTSSKRKSRSWVFYPCLGEEDKYCTDKEVDDKTLNLFPLHPEGR